MTILQSFLFLPNPLSSHAWKFFDPDRWELWLCSRSHFQICPHRVSLGDSLHSHPHVRSSLLVANYFFKYTNKLSTFIKIIFSFFYFSFFFSTHLFLFISSLLTHMQQFALPLHLSSSPSSLSCPQSTKFTHLFQNQQKIPPIYHSSSKINPKPNKTPLRQPTTGGGLTSIKIN